MRTFWNKIKQFFVKIKRQFLSWFGITVVSAVIVSSIIIPTGTNFTPPANTTLGDNLIEGKAWNARPVKDKNGNDATEFHSKWVNYLDKNNKWQEIDASIEDLGTHFEVNKAPFIAKIPKLSTGTTEFIVNNRWDVHGRKTIEDPDFTQTITAVGVAEVSGQVVFGDLGWGEADYVVYLQAYPAYDADLIYWVHHGAAPRLSKYVRFNSDPLLSEDLRLVFDIGFSEDPDINYKSRIPEVAKQNWNKQTKLKIKGSIGHKAPNAVGARGASFKDFKIWDSGIDGNQILKLIDIEYEKVGDDYKLTKIIPKSFFALSPLYPVYTDTDVTFHPDANPETNTVDGKVFCDDGTDKTWATIHGADGADSCVGFGHTAANGTINISARATTDRYAGLERNFALFDTSSIPDGDTISAAVLSYWDRSVTVNWDTTDSPRLIVVVSANPATNTALVDEDMDQTGTVAFSSTFNLFADWAGGNSVYNDIGTFNATGRSNIDKTGISKFATVFEKDRSNTEPEWKSNGQNSGGTHYANQAGTDNDTKLVVTHAAGGATGRGHKIIMNY